MKTHTKPDWGLASCADSLELAIQTEEILACANGEEVQPETLYLRRLKEKLFPRNSELCPGKRFAGRAWNWDEKSGPAPSLGPLDSLRWGEDLEKDHKRWMELSGANKITQFTFTFSGLYWVWMGGGPWGFDRFPLLFLPGGTLKLPLIYLSCFYFRNIIVTRSLGGPTSSPRPCGPPLGPSGLLFGSSGLLSSRNPKKSSKNPKKQEHLRCRYSTAELL